MIVPPPVDPKPLSGFFQTDLHVPRYRPMKRGPWEIREILMAAARGYWGTTYAVGGVTVLTKHDGGDTVSWMSTLPSELESQEIGLRASHGHTVVFGLGMGWLAANIALRPEVERVTIVERDADVIAIVTETGVFDQLPPEARRKIAVVRADALTWRPDSKVDTLQADIWAKILEPQKLDDVRRMQANVSAGTIYFWGQESEIWRHACRRADGVPALDWPTVRGVVTEDIRLPLILPD